MKTVIYEGVISEAPRGDNDYALFIGGRDALDDPLAMRVTDEMWTSGEYLSVRYFISDQPKTEEELTRDLILHLTGGVAVRYEDVYSEITGYLWTDEWLKVGGHDLIDELRAHKGRFCWLEITFAKEGERVSD